MNNCLNCNIHTTNPKFCSQSCSAIFNNKGKRRHGKEPVKCLICGKKCKNYSSKYCSYKCQQTYQYNKRIEVWKTTGYIGIQSLRRYIKEKYNNACTKCRISSWNNKPISLEIEHIDGNSENNNEDNITLLCPNCHSQTSTYKSKNKGNGRSKRRERYKNGKSY